MGKHFFWLHSANFMIRFLAAVWLFLYLTANSIMPFVPALMICAAMLFVACAIWRGYLKLEQSLNVTLQQLIISMPLFDLIKILNERDDIKKLIINEDEEL